MKKEDLLTTFKNMPTLTTERLTLRKMKLSDAADMFDYAHREETTRFLRWSPHKSIAFTKEYLKYIGQRYAVGDFYDWAIVEHESGRMIGTCGFTTIDAENKKGEIGYVLSPDFHRRGYTPEAASAIVRFGFEKLGLNRIEARFMVENDASLKVMKKLGMTYEGAERDAMLIKGKFRTIGVSSILREEFFAEKN